MSVAKFMLALIVCSSAVACNGRQLQDVVVSEKEGPIFQASVSSDSFWHAYERSSEVTIGEDGELEVARGEGLAIGRPSLWVEPEVDITFRSAPEDLPEDITDTFVVYPNNVLVLATGTDVRVNAETLSIDSQGDIVAAAGNTASGSATTEQPGKTAVAGAYATSIAATDGEFGVADAQQGALAIIVGTPNRPIDPLLNNAEANTAGFAYVVEADGGLRELIRDAISNNNNN